MNKAYAVALMLLGGLLLTQGAMVKNDLVCGVLMTVAIFMIALALDWLVDPFAGTSDDDEDDQASHARRRP